jgi:hypothetical protein
LLIPIAYDQLITYPLAFTIYHKAKEIVPHQNPAQVKDQLNLPPAFTLFVPMNHGLGFLISVLVVNPCAEQWTSGALVRRLRSFL